LSKRKPLRCRIRHSSDEMVQTMLSKSCPKENQFVVALDIRAMKWCKACSFIVSPRTSAKVLEAFAFCGSKFASVVQLCAGIQLRAKIWRQQKAARIKIAMQWYGIGRHVGQVDSLDVEKEMVACEALASHLRWFKKGR